ncbi:MAG: Holliday junction resolvase RuvX [Balneolaceae bacterium]|nr:Holliday junction resolvase RuvX [Balneolaceae bacterium]
MQTYSRLVGIDVGNKRIGIAQTDLLKTIATPVGTFSHEEVITALRDIASNATIDAFVVGWPLTTQGEEGKATNRVNEFINRLKKQFPDIPIKKMDERYTSVEAKDLMMQSGVSKKKRREKERVDRIAAALILQRYMESNY